MRRRTFSLLVTTLALAGCNGAGPGFLAGPEPGQAGGNIRSGAVSRVAILLPMSGPDGGPARAMLQAAQLALSGPGAPTLDVLDTHGTPGGAAAAAQQAVQGGDAMLLGPLTSGETAAAAGPATRAGIPMLAFTSDPAQARPGVWVLGLTPDQQVGRLVQEAQSQGKTRFAALVPANAFGNAMARALANAAGGAAIHTYAGGMSAMNVTVRDLSDYANRRGPIEAKIRADRKLDTPEGRKEARELARSAIPPAPFDTLLLADTGVHLAEIGSLLAYYDINPPGVRIMGPALWASPQARAGSAGALNGAWYAAPDPAARTEYASRYQAKYGSPPPPLADIAYDAAAIARVMSASGGVSADSLTRSSGFAGTDGVLALQPDGRVRRALAVFQIDHDSTTIIDPAPRSLGPAA